MLLSLEREQVAAVAYSEDMVAGRIASLPVDPATRELISRIVKWTQRDEALHAQFMRGLLLQSLKGTTRQRVLPTAVVLIHQLVGSVSGWVSAVSHHHDSSSWGIRSAASSAAIRLGDAAGRIPDGLRDELTYRGFRRFCLLNVALEESAVLSYERILEILDEPEHIEAFTRVLEDEVRHSAVFDVLANAFNDNDELRAGMTHDELVRQVAEVSPWFLPADLRGPNDSALGKGSLVHVERGAPDELVESFLTAIRAGGLESIVRANPGPVAVRGHFMMGYHHDDLSNVIHPEAMEALAMQLRAWGATDVAVVETPMAYDRFFANRSVREVAAYFGFDSPHYRIVDVSEDARDIEFERGLVSSLISATWADAPVRIVFSKLRGDPTELAHLSMASFCGIGDLKYYIVDYFH